jgi:hypothetical protein
MREFIIDDYLISGTYFTNEHFADVALAAITRVLQQCLGIDQVNLRSTHKASCWNLIPQ